MNTLLKSGTLHHVKFCRNGQLGGLRGWYQAHGNIELMQKQSANKMNLNGPESGWLWTVFA